MNSDLARRLFTMTAPIAVPMTMIPATTTSAMANPVKNNLFVLNVVSTMFFFGMETEVSSFHCVWYQQQCAWLTTSTVEQCSMILKFSFSRFVFESFL